MTNTPEDADCETAYVAKTIDATSYTVNGLRFAMGLQNTLCDKCKREVYQYLLREQKKEKST